MTVMDYVARFTELARFADDYVAIDMAKVRRFENGLKLSIRARIVGLRLQDMDSMVGTTLTIEREIEERGDSQGVSLLLICRASRWHEDVPESSSPVLLEWDEETRRGLCSTMSHMSAG